ncbi:hypothetical protein GQ457_16G002430 [Hibiscus cannabinus]
MLANLFLGDRLPDRSRRVTAMMVEFGPSTNQKRNKRTRIHGQIRPNQQQQEHTQSHSLKLPKYCRNRTGKHLTKHPFPFVPTSYVCWIHFSTITLSYSFGRSKMDPAPNGEEPTSWDDLYNINLIPSELFLKFRKEIQGFRVGVNLEFYNAPMNDFQTKLVLKPLSPERRWKFAYEPIHQDVRLLSKKIPVTKFLNLQVGVGHNFKMNATGWKWKLTTCLGGDGVSRIQNKTTLGLVPGLDFRFGWRADYVLPEATGGLGTDEPLFNLNSGRLQASLDRVEAIVTHSSDLS